mmetsp:Transcript_111189/g.314636  ORF Transcript_111189/g.314636 Transcript_111189/m.314636 type:complete len:507 (+) Transcript_111189:212-1732(+)|eukprot:CAMPEP_0168411498 /NCGR_PEP_ID=MMETSP0228-20121227/28231_1 /TAXON_ID=133427 /ORGANISM="Protoceratium reticulatum, Strain CCCM 535 (=CCMP 1889)" /LENGTH=506 /DNA_ID=CAMNT_0008425245 /DNA_START=206 /DNA_END=1726 /DNA_ORIENTATION=+
MSLQAAEHGIAASSPPGSPKRQHAVNICRHWARLTGNCRYGDQCRFQHTCISTSEQQVEDAHAENSIFLSAVGLTESAEISGMSRTSRGDTPFNYEAEENGALDGSCPVPEVGSYHRKRKKVRNAGNISCFRRFVYDKFLCRKGPNSVSVLDVAGGKGELAFQMVNLSAEVKCLTVVDPRPLEFDKFRRKLHYGLYTRSYSNGMNPHNTMNHMDRAEAEQSKLDDGTLQEQYLSTTRRVEDRLDASRTTSTRERIEERPVQHLPYFFRPELWLTPEDDYEAEVFCPEVAHDEDFTTNPRREQQDTEQYLLKATNRRASTVRGAFRDNWERSHLWDWKKHGRKKNEALGNDPGREDSVAVDELIAETKAEYEQTPPCTTAASENSPPPDQDQFEESLKAILKTSQSVVQEADLVLGMHPDQAAEWIVDFALQNNKTFFVMPCCVYSKEFLWRKQPCSCAQRSGQVVRYYEELLDWLQAKDESIQRDVLDFDGRNVVLWRIAKGDFDT